MIIYDDLRNRMTDANITSHTIKQSGLMSRSSYTKMKQNNGYVSLETLEKVFDELNLTEIRLVKDGDNYKIILPTETTLEQE